MTGLKGRMLQVSYCSQFLPPPHRRHRARSFPVPRGSTATGGCTKRLALSYWRKKGKGKGSASEWFSVKTNGLDADVSFNVRSNYLTYCIKNPPHCPVSPTDQDPVILQISEETQSEKYNSILVKVHRKTKDVLWDKPKVVIKSVY